MKKFPSLVTFPNFSEAMKNIRQPEKCILIVSGRMGKDRIREIVSKENISAVIVFCMEAALHKKWAEKYEKVKGVEIKFKELENRVRDNFEVFIR